MIRTEADKENLQKTLNMMVDWTEKWGMQFNVTKCKVMHVGRENREHSYTMNGVLLSTTTEERDLGVIMTNSLKPSAQCAKAAKTAQTVLGQISRAFQYRDKQTFVQLYKQYVRPHLEVSVQAWSPWLQSDIEKLEKVQRKAVRMVAGMRATDYEGRLKELGLTTLSERRHQTDILQTYKVLTGKDATDPKTWFKLAAEGPRQTRNATGPLNVQANHGRLEVRRNFYSIRVTDSWNRVPNEIKMMTTVEGFKKAYRKHRAEI